MNVSDLRINEYQIEGGTAKHVADVTLKRMPQREGPDLWAIYDHGGALSKSGKWDLELQPSGRTDFYIKRHRWTSAEEALDFWVSRKLHSRFAHYDVSRTDQSSQKSQ